jgi:hypothetical protein
MRVGSRSRVSLREAASPASPLPVAPARTIRAHRRGVAWARAPSDRGAARGCPRHAVAHAAAASRMGARAVGSEEPRGSRPDLAFRAPARRRRRSRAPADCGTRTASPRGLATREWATLNFWGLDGFEVVCFEPKTRPRILSVATLTERSKRPTINCMEINTNPHDRSFGLRLVISSDGYPPLRGDEVMGPVDAEEAICFGLLRENDSLSVERAKELAAELIRNGRSLHIVASANGRQRHYFGRDPFRRPKFIGCA